MSMYKYQTCNALAQITKLKLYKNITLILKSIILSATCRIRDVVKSSNNVDTPALTAPLTYLFSAAPLTPSSIALLMMWPDELGRGGDDSATVFLCSSSRTKLVSKI